ncbi:MAG TPA: hypothetical protein VFJ84_01945 [Candidatus Saccharimonadales bacterium]|nr:hypothetical protein [Candidatus Saccharimonadales bacterium]
MSMRLARRLPKRHDGQVLITLVIVIPAFILIASAYFSLSTSGYRLERQDQFRTQAQMAADAGADYSVEQLNQDNSWAGTGSEITLQSDSQKKVTFESSITDNSSSSKTINVIGRTYFPASSSTPSATVKINVDLRQVSSGSYSVVSGEGGLYMSNSAKIVGGDVLINGAISLSNTAQIGLSTNPVSVSVADALCPNPPDATYPRVCNAGEKDNPITITNSGHIYGDVKANNQTNPYPSNITNNGLVATSGVAAQALPNYDRASQIAAVTSTISGGFSCSSGSQVWNANTKIVGDVNISNKCKVTVKGNIWITGNLYLSNSASLIVDSGLGSTQPVIMVDGSNGAVISNGATFTSNSSGTGFEIITFWSAASCSPDCSSVTGTDLYNSRGHTTISMSNNSEGPQTVFYARWSQVSVNNGGEIGALLGETVRMSNAATITFGTSSGSLGFVFWVVDGYRQAF